jgi:MFS family permease
LRALQLVALLPIGLVAGVVADRVRRRTLLIWADLGRGMLLASVLCAWWLGVLGLPQLYLVGLLTGALRMVFAAAYSAYLPSLVARDRLIEGNSRLGLSASLSEVAGPGVAGVLVAAATAPFALVLDALSYLASVLSLLLIRRPEAPPRAARDSPGLWADARGGIVLLWRHPTIRAITGYSTIVNFFFQAIHTIFVLFAIDLLGLSPALYGAILMGSSVGAVLGALWVLPLTRRIGPGPALVVAAACYGVGAALIPVASGPVWRNTGILLLAWSIIGIGNGLSNIVSVSIKQLILPSHLLARVSASGTAIGWGAAPLGALLGGLLAEVIGLRVVLLGAAIGAFGGMIWLLCSPLRTMREQPQEGDE